jgi:hypothetical protein
MEGRADIPSKLRSSAAEIRTEHEIIALQTIFSGIFSAMTGIAAIINRNRQIVYTNHEYLASKGLNSMEPLLGKRPGEAISCGNSETGSDGCGTSPGCQYCGIFGAITECQLNNRKTIGEASLSTYSDGVLRSLDLRITCTPIVLDGHDFYVISLQDISDEKRLAALERLFFHDILNTASGLSGLLTVLKDESDPSETRQLINYSEEASRTIIDEISLYRQLRAAEKGDLPVDVSIFNTRDFLKSVAARNTYTSGEFTNRIIVDGNSAGVEIESDVNLLQRVLTNLLKNAVEASKGGEPVYTGVEDKGTMVRFWVRNSAVIRYDIQQQIFQRSFSTKGLTRGLGTYSVKLLTENYLKGKVSFISNALDGTIFSVELKKRFPADLTD